MNRVSRSTLERSPEYCEKYADYENRADQNNMMVQPQFDLSGHVQLYYSGKFVILPATENKSVTEISFLVFLKSYLARRI